MMISQALQRAVKRELAERSLHEFIKQAWHVLEPGTPYFDNWHIAEMCAHLEALSAGTFVDLLLNIPPRFMKSITMVCWKAWEWIRAPWLRHLNFSYSGDLSIRDNIKLRNLILSPWYQSNWGDRFKLAKDQNAKIKFENDHHGFAMASSVDGQGTGEGGDRITVDDPINAKKAHSAAERASVALWWQETMPTRLNSRETGRRCIVMQRLHEEDLSGIVLASGGWEHLCIPFRYEGKAKPTALGWTDPRSVEPDSDFNVSNPECPKFRGELLWPSRFSEANARKLEKELGPYAVAGQLQQRPSPKGGGLLKWSWFRFYDIPPAQMYRLCKRIVISWDTTFKGTQTSKAKDGPDFAVGQVWGEVGADKFLIAQVRGQLEYAEFKAALIQQCKDWPRALTKLIEDKANGSAVLSECARTISGMEAVNPEGGKESRAHAMVPPLASGNIFVPNPNLPGNEWVRDDFKPEVESFPNGKNDDQIDAMSQYVIWSLENPEFDPTGASY